MSTTTETDILLGVPPTFLVSVCVVSTAFVPVFLSCVYCELALPFVAAAPGRFAVVPVTPPFAPPACFRFSFSVASVSAPFESPNVCDFSVVSSKFSWPATIAEPAPTPTILSSVACAIAVCEFSHERSAAIASAVARPIADVGLDSGRPSESITEMFCGVRPGMPFATSATMPRTAESARMPPQLSTLTEACVCSWSALNTLRSGMARLTSARQTPEISSICDASISERTRCTFICHWPSVCDSELLSSSDQSARSPPTPALPAATRASFTLLDGTSTVAPPSASLVAMPAPASEACRSPALRASRLVNAGV